MNFRELTGAALSVVRDTFGESITYTPATGSPVSILAVIDETYEAVDPDTGAHVSEKQYTALVKVSDLPNGSPKKGDKMTRARDSKVFRVIESQADGLGGTLLLLHGNV